MSKTNAYLFLKERYLFFMKVWNNNFENFMSKYTLI